MAFRRFSVNVYAWLRYMELPYIGPSLLVKWDKPPSLHGVIDPAIVKDAAIRGPGGETKGVIIVSEVTRSFHGVAIPLPLREWGPGLYAAGLEMNRGVYTRARLKGYGGMVQVCVYGGKKEAERLGFVPLESTLLKGYASTMMLLGYGEKKEITEPEPLGLEAEIVPLSVSNEVEPGTAVEVQLLFRGEPVPNHKVTVTYVDGHSVETETNENGVALVKTGPVATVVSTDLVSEESNDEYDHVKRTVTLTIQALTL